MGLGLSRRARARYAEGVGAQIFVLGSAVAVAGVVACTGGPGAELSLLDPPGQAADTAFERPKSTFESPGSVRDKPPTTNEAPAISTDPSGAAQGGCPPCGTYECAGTVTTTSSSGSSSSSSTSPTTVHIQFTRQADGSCAASAKGESGALTCTGDIVDGKGNKVGSWQASGNHVTLTASKGDAVVTSCTVGAPSPTPTPTGTATVKPGPTPVPTGAPTQSDAG